MVPRTQSTGRWCEAQLYPHGGGESSFVDAQPELYDMAARIDCTSHQHQKDKMFIIRVSKAMTARQRGESSARCFTYQETHSVRAAGSFIPGSVFAREKPVFINL